MNELLFLLDVFSVCVLHTCLVYYISRYHKIHDDLFSPLPRFLVVFSCGPCIIYYVLCINCV